MPLSKTSQNKFSSLRLDDLIETFSLQVTQNLAFPKAESDKNMVLEAQKLSQKTIQEIDYWNEQELVMKFIAPLLNLVQLCGDDFNTFAERKISAIVDGIKLSGDVDFVVAKGIREPKNPYFFIQEYKKQRQGPDSDPFAQLIGEMLVAQVLNSQDLVYGAYIIGKYWTFVILEKRNYCQTLSLDSTNMADLELILDKLNGIKEYVEEKLKLKII